MLPLLVLAANPLGGRAYWMSPENAPEAADITSRHPTTPRDGLRAAGATVLLLAWFCTQLWSDFDHLIGKTPVFEQHNPYWPLPELSMFAEPSLCTAYADACTPPSTARYAMSGLLVFAVLTILVLQLCRRKNGSIQRNADAVARYLSLEVLLFREARSRDPEALPGRSIVPSRRPL